MTADMAGEWAELLAGLTIDELAAERGAGSAEWGQAVDLAIGARRARDARAPRGRPNGYIAGDSAAWYEAAHAQFLAAERELAGCLVNRRGRAAGIEPMTLWTGPRHVADAYASEELQEFWTVHPRVTVTEYRRQAAADRAAELAEHKERVAGYGLAGDAGGSIRPAGMREQARAEVLRGSAEHDVSRPHARRGAAGDDARGSARAPRRGSAVLSGSYADIVPVAQGWLLEGKIPEGEATLITGAPGVGKGMLMAAITSAVTRGDRQIDGSPAGPAGDVVMVTPEDDSAAGTVHRLMAAGAVLERCHDATELGGGPFLLPGSLPELREHLADWPDTRLVYVDPLLAVSTVSLAAPVTVRQKIVLPLQRLARDYGVAVVVVDHPLVTGAARKALREAFRSVLKVELDKQRPEIRCLSVDKTNIATADQEPLRYVIAGDWPSTHAVFAGESAHAAGATPGTMPEEGTLETVRGWLEHNGPAAASRICAGTRLDYQTVRTALTVLHTGRMVTLAPGGGWQAGAA